MRLAPPGQRATRATRVIPERLAKTVRRVVMALLERPALTEPMGLPVLRVLRAPLVPRVKASAVVAVLLSSP